MIKTNGSTERAEDSSAVPFLDLGPSHRPLAAELQAAFVRHLAASEFVGGASVSAFEELWAEACGTGHAIGVANGTDAIELALRAAGIGPGDEVVVPGNTFIATAHAAAATGADVVFADVDPVTLLVRAADVAAVLTPRTRAVVVVHLFGNAADMDELGLLSRSLDLILLEDCAQAHGARWRGQAVGSFGDAGCFSFYPSKNLGALGDGGAVVTSNSTLAERVRSLADHGRSHDQRNSHVVVGRNSRLDAVQAGCLSVKLPHLETWNTQRREAHALYARLLVGTPGLEVVQPPPGSTSVHHLEVVRVVDRRRVQEKLRLAGVATGVHYPVPCHRQRSMVDQGAGRQQPVGLPVVEAAAESILSLPMYPGIPSEQVERVCTLLKQACAGQVPRVASGNSRRLARA